MVVFLRYDIKVRRRVGFIAICGFAGVRHDRINTGSAP